MRRPVQTDVIVRVNTSSRIHTKLQTIERDRAAGRGNGEHIDFLFLLRLLYGFSIGKPAMGLLRRAKLGKRGDIAYIGLPPVGNP